MAVLTNLTAHVPTSGKTLTGLPWNLNTGLFAVPYTYAKARLHRSAMSNLCMCMRIHDTIAFGVLVRDHRQTDRQASQ